MKRIGVGLIRSFSMILMICLFSDCVENNIGIAAENILDQNGNTSGNTDDNQRPIRKGQLFFDVNLYNMIPYSKSIPDISPINTDRYVDIYAYRENQQIASTPCISKTVGSISPVVGDYFSLLPNTYDLFFPGVNTMNIHVPSFPNGVQSVLRNKIDYIWALLPDVVVDSVPSSHTVDMKHCCTQVVLCLSQSSGVSIDARPVIQLTPSVTSGSFWTLKTGVIKPAEDVSSLMTSLGVTAVANKYYAQIIMMPLEKNGNMTASFTMPVNGEDKPVVFNVLLPVYQNSLKAGYSYQYNIVLKETEIQFVNVELIDWVAVDATDSPIIPIEI